MGYDRWLRKSGDVQRLDIIALLRVAKTQTSNAHLIAGHFFQRPVGVQDDIAIFDFIHQALNEDFFSAETVTAMDKVHFRSDVGQISASSTAVLPPPITATF